MEEKDIIEVEVNETLVDESTPISEEKPIYSDEEIDSMVVELQQLLAKKDTKAYSLAMDIAKNSKEYLDNETYLWVMYAYALKYESENNLNGANFAYLRLRDVYEQSKGKMRQAKALTFIDTTIPEEVIAKAYEKTNNVDILLKSARKQFFILEIGMIAFVSLFMFFFFQYSLVMAFGIAVLAGVANVLFSYQNLLSKYRNSQLNAWKSYATQDLIDFDLPIARS